MIYQHPLAYLLGVLGTAPAALNAVYCDTPVLIVWHFQLGWC